ncbi:MAG: hypothetical protein EPN85_03200 [Bacteroidetes bacterium]|nr:MAG: hypothetical protein EPN85_03200 [Bacteroidota bacterium]
MSKREINPTCVLLAVSLLFCCCDDKEKAKVYLEENYKNYSTTHSIIIDSVQTYLDSLLETFTPEYVYGWTADSLVCINSTNDKLFAVTIEKPKGKGKGFFGEDAMELLGKKINGKWYFFRGGGTLTIPRDMYGLSEFNPPSEFFLSQIARKNMLESALVKENGEYVVSDEWIDNKFYNNGYGSNLSREEYDKVHWMLIMRKWKEKIDTNEYKPLKKNNSQKPNT